MAPTSSSSVIQGHHCRPLPSGPPSPSLISGSSRPNAPPGGDITSPVADHRDPDRRPRHAGSVSASHARTTSARKPSPPGGLLGELLVAAVAVEADGGAADEHAGERLERGQGLDERPGAEHPGVADRPLVLLGPAVVADAGAGQVDGGVDAGRGPPSRRCRRPGPRTSSAASAGRRTSRTTSWPPARSRATSAVPMRPDAPVTAIFTGPSSWPVSAGARRRRRADARGRCVPVDDRALPRQVGQRTSLRPSMSRRSRLSEAEVGLERALLEPLLDRDEEAGGVGAVDEPVVVGQRQVDHRADRDRLAAVGVRRPPPAA